MAVFGVIVLLLKYKASFQVCQRTDLLDIIPYPNNLYAGHPFKYVQIETGGHRVRTVCGGQSICSVLHADVEPQTANRQYYAETGSYIGTIELSGPGVYEIRLYLEEINREDPVGLVVNELILKPVKDEVQEYNEY